MFKIVNVYSLKAGLLLLHFLVRRLLIDLFGILKYSVEVYCKMVHMCLSPKKPLFLKLLLALCWFCLKDALLYQVKRRRMQGSVPISEEELTRFLSQALQ